MAIVRGTPRKEYHIDNQGTPAGHPFHHHCNLTHFNRSLYPIQDVSSSSSPEKLRPKPSAPRLTTTIETSGARIGNPGSCTITILPKGGKGFSPATIKTPPSEISRVS